MEAVTLDEGLRIVAAGIAAARERGVLVSVAVIGPHGWLVAQATMDGAKIVSSDIARGKAFASAAFRQDTAVLEEKATTRHKELFYETVATTQPGRLVISQGGVVLWRDGVPVGAVGVSGTTPQGDEQIGRAAASAAGFVSPDVDAALAVGDGRVDVDPSA